MFYQFSNKIEIVSGKGSVEELAEQMTKRGARNILLISDQNIKKLGYVKIAKDIIAKNTRLRINAVYVNIKNGASTANIEEAYSLFRDNSCDSIIAVGGDSVMNAAKVLHLMLSTRTKDLKSIYGTNSAKISENVPFGVVATTIGASRGIGKAAFVKEEKTGKRMEFITEIMQPNFCILDPYFSLSLPADKMALNAIEMIVNCIELYLGKQRNPISKNYALYATGMLKDSLSSFSETSDVNENMRFNLQEIAATAGIAISSSAGGMSLALANAVFDVSGCNRNEALAVIFPGFLNAYLECSKDSFEEILQYGFDRKQFIAIEKNKRPEAFVESVKYLINRVLTKYKLPTRLSELEVTEDMFDEIAKRASIDSALLDCPAWFDKEDLVKILKECI